MPQRQHVRRGWPAGNGNAIFAHTIKMKLNGLAGPKDFLRVFAQAFRHKVTGPLYSLLSPVGRAAVSISTVISPFALQKKVPIETGRPSRCVTKTCVLFLVCKQMVVKKENGLLGNLKLWWAHYLTVQFNPYACASRALNSQTSKEIKHWVLIG